MKDCITESGYSKHSKVDHAKKLSFDSFMYCLIRCKIGSLAINVPLQSEHYSFLQNERLRHPLHDDP